MSISWIPYTYPQVSHVYVRECKYTGRPGLIRDNSNRQYSNLHQMIGFQPELQEDIAQVDEGLDTKNLLKKELYDMVSAVWHLPPYSSKGVTRDYLLRVNGDQVFRVNSNELKRFEVELSKDQQKKNGTVNNALLVKNSTYSSRHRQGESWASQSTRYQSLPGSTRWPGKSARPIYWRSSRHLSEQSLHSPATIIPAARSTTGE